LAPVPDVAPFFKQIFRPYLIHATTGAVMIGTSRKKWMLVYGLVTSLLIMAIVSLRFGSAPLGHGLIARRAVVIVRANKSTEP
jgi:hypothetical protein